MKEVVINTLDDEQDCLTDCCDNMIRVINVSSVKIDGQDVESQIVQLKKERDEYKVCKQKWFAECQYLKEILGVKQ